MIRVTNAPTPNIISDRALGLELEIDPICGSFPSSLSEVPGWSEHHDGSLSNNGAEYVFDRPVKLAKTKERIEAFCTALTNVGLSKRGGLHVHVQGNNYTTRDCYSLVVLYAKLGNIINCMVGESRRSNKYCQCQNAQDLVSRGFQHFVDRRHLETMNSSRAGAKHEAERYLTVNTNMMCVSNPDQRSIEFRQGSVSKRAASIFGWTCFVLALTEAAKDHDAVDSLPMECDFETTINFLRAYEQSSGSTIADWVKWRFDYMNYSAFTQADIDQAMAIINNGGAGIFGLSSKLDINLAVAKRLVDELVARGLVHKGRKCYHANKSIDYSADYSRALQSMTMATAS